MHAKSAKEERRGTCRNYNFGTGGGAAVAALPYPQSGKTRDCA